MSLEEVKEERKFNPRKSHWLTSFGFEGMRYPVQREFTGAEKSFVDKDQELYGSRLGVGGELYLGAGIITTTKLEAYYVGTLFARRLNAGPEDEDEEFSFTKTTGQVFGIEASQSIGFLFDMKTKNPFMDEWAYLTVEPFIEAGIGMGWAYNRVRYEYDTGPSGVQEAYKQTVRDNLLNARIGAGVNFTASSGYFLYLKAFVNSYDVTKRKIDTYSQPDGTSATSSSTNLKDVKIDPITTYAIGGGYKF